MRREHLAAVGALVCLLQARTAFGGIDFAASAALKVESPHALVIGDLNSDGRADVVVVSSSNPGVATFVGDDTPSGLTLVQVLHVGQGPSDAALGDLDADGQLDMVVADPAANRLLVLLGAGDGSFRCPIEVSVDGARRVAAVALGDFDENGRLDIAVADDGRGRLFLLRNDSGNPPGFLRGGELDVGSDDLPRDLHSLDLNGDGMPDLLAATHRGRPAASATAFIWRRAVEGFAEFFPVQRFPIGERPELGQIAIGDFDRDGTEDAAVLNRARAEDILSQIHLLLGRGDGMLALPIPFTLTCPFFNAGAPCRGMGLAAADVDANGSVDLIVTASNPRSSTLRAPFPADALQVLVGHDDGSFSAGPVFAAAKGSALLGAGDVTGDGLPDIVAASRRTNELHVLINASTPGSIPIGEQCLLGEECISDRCTNGICCIGPCGPDEICNIPGREGRCLQVLAEVIECRGTGPVPACDPAQFCVDGFCCDQVCDGGRCDRQGLIGVCIPGVQPGEPCIDDDHCASGDCADNFICCIAACDAGRCEPDTGICRLPTLPTETCEDDDECLSGVCDAIASICCDRICDPDDEICAPGEGVCRSLVYTPAMTRQVPTPSPLLCVMPATPTPTALPTLPTVDPCASCPPGRCSGGIHCLPESLDDDGCSTATSGRSAGLAAHLVLLPIALWAVSRRQRRNDTNPDLRARSRTRSRSRMR